MTSNGRNAYGSPYWDDLLLVYSLYEIDSIGEAIPGDQRYWIHHVFPQGIYYEDFERIVLDVLADSTLVLRMEVNEVADLEDTREAINAMQDASKIARRGIQRIVPRVARIAAKSTLRYVNGMLMFYDIISFFDRDRFIGAYERHYTPDELHGLYRQTGAVGTTWMSETVNTGDEDTIHRYELEARMWLYGYFHHRLAE